MLGRVPDDTESIVKAIHEATSCDLIITTGGASVGDHELIDKVYQTIGAELLFSRVAIKPGIFFLRHHQPVGLFGANMFTRKRVSRLHLYYTKVMAC